MAPHVISAVPGQWPGRNREGRPGGLGGPHGSWRCGRCGHCGRRSSDSVSIVSTQSTSSILPPPSGPCVRGAARPGGSRRRLRSVAASRLGGGWGSPQLVHKPRLHRRKVGGGRAEGVGRRSVAAVAPSAILFRRFAAARPPCQHGSPCRAIASRSPEAGIVLIPHRLEPHVRPWRRAAGGSCGALQPPGRIIRPTHRRSGAKGTAKPPATPNARAAPPPSPYQPASRQGFPGGAARAEPHRPHAARPREAAGAGPGHGSRQWAPAVLSPTLWLRCDHVDPDPTPVPAAQATPWREQQGLPLSLSLWEDPPACLPCRSET